MLKIIFKGHDNFYGLSDIVRLFFAGPTEDRDNGMLFLEDGPDITIISEISSDGVVRTFEEGKVTPYEEYPGIPLKRAVKISLYKFLSKLKGREYPWGALTGIRPTLVALEEDFDPESLSRKYLVRPDKALLASVTSRKEQQTLTLYGEDTLAVYVGVPFCPSRCEYCSFISQDVLHHMDLLETYKKALEREIKVISSGLKRKISAVYMGGGTPTVFEDRLFAELIETIRERLPFADDTEFTVEAGRPDTITGYKLEAMRDAGVGRICINPQTMNSETLMKLNRRHSAEDAVKTYDLARQIGIETINMDLIAGLKYETADDLISSVNKLVDLDPENITIHTLYKKRRASMGRDEVLDRDNSRGSTDEALSKAYDILEKNGYAPYYLYRQKDTGHGLENTGFAKNKTECYYNVAMMSDRRDVLSFGAGGMSKRIMGEGRLERCSSIKDVKGYIEQVDELADKKIRFFD